MNNLLLFLPILLFSVVIHEFAHAWQARREGDNTAYMLGRVTLNPIPHIDLFGSILFPVVLALSNAPFMFGWAKPVPVDPRNYRNYKMGDIRVSLAGIVSNLLLATFCVLVFAASFYARPLMPDAGSALRTVQMMALQGVGINLVLALFNLLPIPPLDGSHVFYHMLPPELGVRYREVGRYGMLILLGLMIFARGAFEVIYAPVLAVLQLVIRLWT